MRKMILALCAVVTIAGLSLPASAHRSSKTTMMSTTSQDNAQYAALGDSIAAGSGLSDSGLCNRSSNQAYPELVAAATNMQLNQLACSGATTQSVLNNQLDEAFSSGTPQLITITIGANDMRWAQFVRMCASGTCGTSEDSNRANQLRANLEQNMQQIFIQIQERSGGSPPLVIVTGYSNPVSNYCKGRQDKVSNKEINWLNKQRDSLNKSIRKSMEDFSFARYASTNFNGHALCSPDSFVQQLDDDAPLHPNAEGQQLIANSVVRQMN